MKEFELEKIYNWQILSEKIKESTGGAAVWGSITGTLSSQTDLVAALSTKYDASNPAGYITIAALAPFLTSAVASTTYLTITNAASTYLSIANAITTYQPLLGFTPENVANKSTDGTLSANSDTLYASQKAVKTYIDASVSGVLDDRGNWDASGNAFPTTGGSGPGGSILKGDLWFVSVPGILGGTPVVVGNNFRALVDNPTLSSDWNILNVGLGYIPENIANKGIANGYASLDATGKVPASQIKYNTVITHGHNTAVTYGTTVSPRYFVLSGLRSLGIPSDLGGTGLTSPPPLTWNGRMSPIPKTGTIVSAKFSWYITLGSNTQLYSVEFNNRTTSVRTTVTTALQIGPSFSGRAKIFVVSGLNIPVTENDQVFTIITCPTIVGTPCGGIVLSVDYIIQ